MQLPPDRSNVGTEQRHPRARGFDELPTLSAVQMMAAETLAVHTALMTAAPAIARFIDELALRMARGGRLIYAGAGTSGRLGVLDASECPPTFCSDPGQVVGIIAGGDSALRKSSEGMEDDPDGISAELARLDVGAEDAVVAIAAGGTTPYARGALRLAKSRGALTALLAHAQCELPEGCDHMLLVETGPEVIAGSTRLKAGTASKTVLNMISTIAFSKQGKVWGDLMIDLAATNDKLRDRALRLLQVISPQLNREEAAQALDAAGWKLKTAIVMQRCAVTRAAAESMIARARGNLRAVLAAT
ncbi:MAG: N-acetylmuramic acid 6-phosphate etherase [Phycisphaerales bacterium]|nr:N-acetylmuramic acid 6-phosphate etherase [Phycisphaerales bacterium]